MNKSATFKTKDLGEAAVLLTLGFVLIDTVWQGEVAYFSFDRKEEAEKIAHQYNFGGVQVTAKNFHDNLVLIKRKILARYAPNRFRKDVRINKPIPKPLLTQE